MKISYIARIKKSTRRFLEWCKLHRESFQDANRYYQSASWAGPVEKHKIAHLRAELIKHYHVLEKGLVMSDFRPRSGIPIVKQLVVLVSRFGAAGGAADDCHFQVANSVLQAYHQRHEDLGIDVSDLIPLEILELKIPTGIKGGSKLARDISSDELAKFDRIALSRHSVRQFDPERRPERDLIVASVKTALSAPSVCNRQTWRVHLYEGSKAQEVLSLQNGNRGFGHLIPTVAVVTSDMRYFAGGAERFQGWIEGGLFSMNFLLSLHARGLSSVALNWSRLNKDDLKLRAVGEIPAYERIIMLIGIGYALPEHIVASSFRSTSDQFITWH